MLIIQHLIILLSYKTIAKCELYLLPFEKSISSGLYHGLYITYKTLVNQSENENFFHHFIIPYIDALYKDALYKHALLELANKNTVFIWICPYHMYNNRY